MSSAQAQHELPNPPSDAISAVRFSPRSHKLLVSSWDKHIYVYSIGQGGDSRLVDSYEHRAPVLDACWGADDDTAYTVGLDWDVRRVDLNSKEQTVLSTHNAAASRVAYSAAHRMLVSTSWDGSMHVHQWDVLDTDGDGAGAEESRQEMKMVRVPLAAKPFALALSPSKLVVAMAGRAVAIYDLAAIGMLVAQAGGATAVETGERGDDVEVAPWQRRDSSLKFMTRAAACMPDDRGYATSSIEGRVAVEWFADDAATQEKKYAFKCHRQPAPPSEGDGIDVVYPVNALAFHPQYGTFASGGGDGVVSVWDLTAKKRIRNYTKLGASVAGLDWSHDGNLLAIGISDGFEDGKEYPPENGEMTVKVLVRELAEGEAKPKAK